MSEEIKRNCYLDIEVDKKFEGRLEIDLFWDTTPITCKNFAELCIGNNFESTLKSTSGT